MTGIAERPRISPLTSRQVSDLRVHLDAERDQTLSLIQSIQDEMGAFVDARRDTPTDDEHDPEGPTLAFERSQASVALAQSELHVREIDLAIERIEDGSYGLCTNCHSPIKLSRLQVRPRAAHCIQCAERIG
jgi:RNA polymerase-binding transcription factor DksA